ncbi:MAG TPA: ATP-binding cassette domain-containing protein [Candidatus Limnocylindrales bacterium]|nr:ATP-binding cassette domain-containing protein [Candidatus Limnocylindrales bacterium]
MTELLRTENLTKSFQGLIANQDINFILEAGTIRCIIGPNGAGKTTFISLISGHQKPTRGTIWFKGQNITHFPVYSRARMGIVRKFQTPSLFTNLSVYENVELAVLGTNCPPKKRHNRILQILELVRLSDSAGQPVQTLSHGQKQWLEIGLLLANEAELLLLDEPTAGMTAEETASTGELVRNLVYGMNLSAIIIEHDIHFIRNLQAPVTVLHLGRILVEGTFEEIQRNEQVRNVYLGEE